MNILCNVCTGVHVLYKQWSQLFASLPKIEFKHIISISITSLKICTIIILPCWSKT